MDRKWKWSLDFYDDVFRLCAALTIVHVRTLPLRQDDGARYRQSRNRLFSIGQDIRRGRAVIVVRYNERRRVCLNTCFRAQ